MHERYPIKYENTNPISRNEREENIRKMRKLERDYRDGNYNNNLVERLRELYKDSIN
ncbi:hypothetical protein J4221_00040 [Candidatus Pacearchaeota archaeon]|nr:hypothetical protein [Candidatus Pacearchaeota archaeon]